MYMGFHSQGKGNVEKCTSVLICFSSKVTHFICAHILLAKESHITIRNF